MCNCPICQQERARERMFWDTWQGQILAEQIKHEQWEKTQAKKRKEQQKKSVS